MEAGKTFRHLNLEHYVEKLRNRTRLLNQNDQEHSAEERRKEVQELREEFRNPDVRQQPIQQCEILFQLYSQIRLEEGHENTYHDEKIGIMSQFLESRQFVKCKESPLKDVVLALAGLTYIQAENYWPKAEAIYKKLSKSKFKFTNDSASYLPIMFFDAYLENGSPKTQLELMDKLLKNCFSASNVNPYAYCLFIKGKALMKQEDYPGALEVLRNALKIYQTIPWMKSMALKKVPIEETRRHAMLDQNRVQTALAECHQAMGKYKVALKLYKKISVECFPNEGNGAFENTWYLIFHNAHLQTVHCQVYIPGEETRNGVPLCLGAFKMILTSTTKGKKHLTKQKWYLKIQALIESISQMSAQIEKTLPLELAVDQYCANAYYAIQKLKLAGKFEDALIRIDHTLAYLNEQTHGMIPAKDKHVLYCEKVKCLDSLDRPEEGVEYFEELLADETFTKDLRPSVLQALHVDIATLYCKMGFFEDAKHHLKMMVKLDGDWTAIKSRIDMFSDLAKIYLELRNPEKALDYVNQCKVYDLNSHKNELEPRLLNQLDWIHAECFFQIGEYERAEKSVSTFLAMTKFNDVNRVRMFDLHGRCLRMSGNGEKAISQYMCASELEQKLFPPTDDVPFTPMMFIMPLSGAYCMYETENYALGFRDFMEPALECFKKQPEIIPIFFRIMADRDVVQFTLHFIHEWFGKKAKKHSSTLRLVNSLFITDMFRNVKHQKEKRKTHDIFCRDRFWQLVHLSSAVFEKNFG